MTSPTAYDDWTRIDKLSDHVKYVQPDKMEAMKHLGDFFSCTFKLLELDLDPFQTTTKEMLVVSAEHFQQCRNVMHELSFQPADPEMSISYMRSVAEEFQSSSFVRSEHKIAVGNAIELLATFQAHTTVPDNFPAWQLVDLILGRFQHERESNKTRSTERN